MQAGVRGSLKFLIFSFEQIRRRRFDESGFSCVRIVQLLLALPPVGALPRDLDTGPSPRVRSAQHKHSGGKQMTSRRRNLALGLLWLALAFLRLDRAGAAPAVARLNPSAGQVGHVVTLQGSDLAGNDLQVWFGAARALDVRNPGGTDRVIRVLVPNKVDPRDPDTVAVTVTVDGVEATAPAAPLYFTYSIPQPSPEITDFMTDDPSRPRLVLQGQSFVLTLSGSNFFLARRVPQRCIVLGGEREESDVLMSSSSDTSVSCSFPGLQ